MTDIELLQQPFTLPCGVPISNRICKSAMNENLADIGGKPSERILKLYETWGKSRAGLLITGNVMIDHRALGEKHNIYIEDETHLTILTEWARLAQQEGSSLWMQINHPGRQAPKAINKETVAPSAVGLSQKSMFATPRPLTEAEIWALIDKFGTTAAIAQKAGFSGVQIHGAHGYLVSQFLSSNTNLRTDQWGGSLENRARFAVEVYRNMRKKVGANFPIGIKINSADFQRGAFTEEDSLQVIDILSKESIDMIEVSGGTYEKAAMMGLAAKESTRKREAYFADFIIKARKSTQTPLMLTGGFRSLKVMAAALRGDELDFIGMARPFAQNPTIAADLLNGKTTKCEIHQIKVGIKAIDQLGLLDTTWHAMQIRRIGEGKAPDLGMSGWKALFHAVKAMIFGV